MREIYATLEGWGGALYVGFNSISFDEEFLRHALFLTLHPPYLTSMPGNGRADALALVRTVALLRLGSLHSGMRDGRPSFRLEDVCNANGIPHDQAHTAMGDVTATLELCRRARDGDEDTWARFLRNSTKSAVAEIIDVESAFVHVRFKGNEAIVETLTSIATDTTNPSARLCLPASFDAERFLAAPDDVATEMLKSADGVRFLKINKSPIVCALDDAPAEAIGLDEQSDLARGNALRDDEGLKARVVQLVGSKGADAKSPAELEDMLYHALPDGRDRALLRDFQSATWKGRRDLAARFHDPRHRAIARRLLYLERPDLLDNATRHRMADAVDKRVADRTAAVLKPDA